MVKSQTDAETLTVVFVERKLSVEDLSQCKLNSETCFRNLRNIEQKTYLTSVEDPVQALHDSFSDNSQKTISLSNEADLQNVDVSGNEKVLFVHLDSVESSEDFAKHGQSNLFFALVIALTSIFLINTDELMNKLFNSISLKRENVVAIYTARHPSFVSFSTFYHLKNQVELDNPAANSIFIQFKIN